MLIRGTALLLVALIATAPAMSQGRRDRGQRAPASPIQEIETAIGRVSLYPELIADAPVEQRLGFHAMCALANATTSHAVQACGCSVAPNRNGRWILALSADSSVDGLCGCQAICLDEAETEGFQRR
jgi:hypothetical protein